MKAEGSIDCAPVVRSLSCREIDGQSLQEGDWLGHPRNEGCSLGDVSPGSCLTAHVDDGGGDVPHSLGDGLSQDVGVDGLLVLLGLLSHLDHGLL